MEFSRIFKKMRRRVFPKEILFIFCLAFLLRILFCLLFKKDILYIQEHIFTDTQAYMQIAGNVLSGKGLIAPGGTVASHPPLYPLFLSGVYFLFGEGYWPVRIVQGALSALSCVVVYLLTRPVLNAQTAKLASFLCAIYPFFIFFSLQPPFIKYMMAIIEAMMFVAGKDHQMPLSASIVCFDRR